MLGIRYLKVAPTTHVIQFKSSKIVREGAGASFFYFAPTSTIVYVPLASVDVPFVFNEVTADFQDATIQGELTFRVTKPSELAMLLDFSVDHNGRFRSDDPTKLNDRLIHATQILARGFAQKKSLAALLISGDELVVNVATGIRESPMVAKLGIEVMDLTIASIKPTPEMAKALQADAREKLLQQADEAI